MSELREPVDETEPTLQIFCAIRGGRGVDAEHCFSCEAVCAEAQVVTGRAPDRDAWLATVRRAGVIPL